jgi:hypothetical protein
MADPIQERGLRAKIREFLEGRHKSATVKKVMRIVDGFPTIEAFCTAHKSEWLAKYRAARPKSEFDLGVKVMRAIEEVIAFVREDKRNAQLDLEAKKKAEAEAALKEQRENPKFSLGELKALVNFMELCDVKELDLRGIREFLSKIGVKVKELA